MANITEKQNYMMCLNGEQPLWIPRNGFGQDPYSKYPPPKGGYFCSVLMGKNPPPPGVARVDLWGTEYIATEDTGGMALPRPGKFILPDITKWQDYIKIPDLSDVNWELTCKRDMEFMPVNREQQAVGVTYANGYFQDITTFMGFTEGLCAFFEEPEAVAELLDALATFYETVINNTIDYYKPDTFGFNDDAATANDPFISMDMFNEMLMPVYKRHMQAAMDRGIPIEYHNCGRCEDQVRALKAAFDIKQWNPAQTMNDLDAVKKEFGNSLVLCGCWDSSGPVGWRTATEELVREAVRDTIDRYAKGGGFMFWGSVYGAVGDEYTENKKRWISEEVDSYGRSFYNK